MEKQKQKPASTQMQDYDKTNRNFQATDEEIKKDEKQKAKLQPEKYPVNDSPVKNSK